MYGEVCAAAYVCFWPEADIGGAGD